MKFEQSFQRDIDPTLWEQCVTMLEEQGYTYWVTLPDNSLLLSINDDDVLYFIENYSNLLEYADINFIPLTNDSSRTKAMYALETFVEDVRDEY
tara:strand:- start:177 stop:458 length:282 start_codon:yes stop_codon:yes gene_type:complete